MQESPQESAIGQMIVVLAEKPSVARELARILGAKSRQEGYLEGNGYQVTWAVGHLVGLADTRDYGYPRWSLDTLPIIPDIFRTKLVTKDQRLTAQYETIARLFAQAKEIICATDAGREGELIFRYIYQHSQCNRPFKRLWISSQTDKAIKEGFAKLKDGKEYDNLFQAARCRSEADWLVGINATQGYTLRYGNKPPFFNPGDTKTVPVTLGRVQTPVLKLLVDRYLEAKAFNAETYWEIILNLGKGEGEELQSFQAKWFDPNNENNERFLKEAEGKVILEKIGETVVVASAKSRPKVERPPQFYDLTELQKDANKRYNFSAKKTLDLAQDLYEKFKTITYPRTDSRYLSSDLFPTIPGLLGNLSSVGAYAPFVQKAQQIGLTEDKRFFDDKKVSDHHAIIPTETEPARASMPKEHFMIYDLISRRFIGAFLGNCEKELTEIILEDAGEQFRAKGTMIKVIGWREIYDALDKALNKRKQAASKKAKSASSDDAELPYVTVGESLKILEKTLPKKKTKAPAIHTESSILGMMETAGKNMEDESLREAMKDRGLGTPATRAGMIEKLIFRNYIERDKKKLIPTEKGIALIQLVRERAISNPDLTGEWEMRLNQMAKGDYDSGQFMKEVRQYTTSIIHDLKGIRRPAPVMPPWTLDATCPKCGKGKILKGKRAFGCSRYKEGCDFVIRPLIAGKFVEKESLEELLASGMTERFVQGFVSRSGKRFDARLRLSDSYKVEFFFDKQS